MVIAHDFAYQYGGAERVTEALAKAFPGAPIIVIGGRSRVLERMGVADRARSLLPLDRLESRYRALSPVFPLVVRRERANVVLSSSYAFSHHVRARDLHVEYCHSPLRQVWIAPAEYERAAGAVTRAAMRLFGRWLRAADQRAVARVDVLVANSENVRGRIRRIYGREAAVLHPPVATHRFSPASGDRDGGLAVLVARLVEPYKAVRSALDAFRELPYRLVVIGSGRDAAALRRHAPPNVTFVGELEDPEIADWYNRASVVVFPGEDDFGLVPVEAMACGTPVVALDAGGARETVVDGVTGLLFPRGGLAAAVRDAMARRWDAEAIRARALEFSEDAFVAQIRAIVDTAIREQALAGRGDSR